VNGSTARVTRCRVYNLLTREFLLHLQAENLIRALRESSFSATSKDLAGKRGRGRVPGNVKALLA
jgi:hypothetical protein